jgi:PAS domain S-box-containing protein
MTDQTEDFIKAPRDDEETQREPGGRREEQYEWLLSRVSKVQLLDELQRQHTRVSELEAGDRDLKRTQELLADCERKYRFIERNTLDTVMAFDSSFRLFYCSPSVESLTGFKVEEVVQRRVEKIVAPASLKTFMSRFAEQLNPEWKQENSHTGAIELELLSKEGSSLPVSGRLRIIWEDDAPSQIILVIQDMRGQKLMERALHQEIQRYRIFFQKAQEPMCIVTPQGTLVEVNDAWTKLLGYTPHEVLGLNVKTIMPEIALAYAEPEETSSLDWETWLKKRDGSIITCLITAITWASPEQTLLGHFFVVRNRREAQG